MSDPPDVTFLFAEDVVEWDSYLSRQLELTGVRTHHEQIEKMSFPLGPTYTTALAEARVVVVIVSPALVRFLDQRAADAYQFTRLLKPGRTIGMVCGASQASISSVKNVLISYDEWRHLEAKDQDINMVRKVMEMIQVSLAQSKETDRINKPKFKLVPRKVHEGNGKVYVMLAKPLDNSVKVRITLEDKGSREIPVKKRNPYTLVFVIPDDLIHVQNMLNVHVWFGEELMGISSVKCASKLGELYSLLASAPSPYEFMRNTLGVGSLHEVDLQLGSVFRKNLPKSGFSLLQFEGKHEKGATSDEFPTLLHFAARYGLSLLVNELLLCPGAQTASAIRNAKGMTPAQMANHEGHNKVAAAIDDFGKTNVEVKPDLDKPVPCPQTSISEKESNTNGPSDYYDIPASNPVPVLHLPANRMVGTTMNDRESDYMKMKGAQKENIEPCQNVFLDEHLESMKNTSPIEPKAKITLLESQAKLIEIMEAYKKGASLTEVERLQNEWKSFYQVSDAEAKSTLDGLRNLYAKAQKAKLNKKHSTSFSELRQFLTSKLRRKESIDSKGTTSRRNSKDSNSSERLPTEPEAVRPVSTLSVHSNASSSSGSSFDRLSMASAGSDSGHHSDFGEERSNKKKDRFESRYKQRVLNPSSNVANIQKLTLSSKPPAPPPRPYKPNLNDVKDHYSNKMVAPSFEEALKLPEFSPPGSKSLTLSSDWRTHKQMSLPFTDFSSYDGPNSDYDCPPPPRPSSSASKPIVREMWHLPPVSPCDPKMDYDIVPPPLPLSAPPQKQQEIAKQELSPNHAKPLDFNNLFDQCYDIPASMRQRSTSLSTDYDFPRTTLMDGGDSCSCQIMSNRNNLNSVKKCCATNDKMSPLETNIVKKCCDKGSSNNIAKISSNKMSSLESLPSVPSFDLSMKMAKLDAPSYDKCKPLGVEVRAQYSNVFLHKEGGSHRDSIPEEIAPPPPVLMKDNPEEYYKMVGAPIPVNPAFQIS
ncbi:hypothetical protein JTE90_026184 [Oedothorax gibbosus]|uniref:DBB domain-containing protein n=1 Tax=Oedothorax gibbosus TaxID=931172 RepID=A0AAV6UG54_9ARAC|nr:hypothetical protein JTE90_026184 [Oedothorax gibbosus]